MLKRTLRYIVIFWMLFVTVCQSISGKAFQEEAPSVELESNASKSFSSLEGSVEFKCIVTAFPEPEIVWSFRPCNKTCAKSDMEATEWWEEIPRNNVSAENDLSGRKWISRLSLFIKENSPGVLKCLAKNSFSGHEYKAFKVQQIPATEFENRILESDLERNSDDAIPDSSEERTKRWIFVGSSVGAIIFILVPILIFVCFRLATEKKRRRELEYLERMLKNDTANFEMIDPSVPLTEQVQFLPYEEKWEVPPQNLKFCKKILGSGHFGRVVMGEATDLLGIPGKTIVAVKMLKETADIVQRKALLGEIKIMAHIGQHLNVVNLLGALTKNMLKGELYMLTEYCKYGSLMDYLQKHQYDKFFNQVDAHTGQLIPLSEEEEKIISKQKQDLLKIEKDWDGRIVTTRDLFCYSFQISNGMNYLVRKNPLYEGLENQKNVIHRDLASRNVLMAEDNVVKICDFGLAKQDYIYMRTNQTELPVKWMAIESIDEKIFSKKSDVWAFGILLWELFTLGKTPYPGKIFDTDFVERLRNGYRMEQPIYAPNDVYEIMRHCWEGQPKNRPDFVALSAQFGNLLENSTRKKYLDLNTPYQFYNEEHFSGYLNDPKNRLSQLYESSQYVVSYQLSPPVAPQPSIPVRPVESLRSTGIGQNALDAVELHPMLNSSEPSSPLNCKGSKNN